MSFGLALLSIVFVNMYTGCYYNLVCRALASSLLLALGTRAYAVSPLMIQVASMPFGLVSTHMSLISCNTCLLKLPFFGPESHRCCRDCQLLMY